MAIESSLQYLIMKGINMTKRARYTFRPKQHYSRQQLVNFAIRDLINDYRATVGHFASGELVQYHGTSALVALAEYCADCKAKAAHMFRNRHRADIGRHGEIII